MCARIPISLDTCKGPCPLFYYTPTHSRLGFKTKLYPQIHTLQHTSSDWGTDALETNYQSGVSSYFYFGHRGANEHLAFPFFFVFCFCYFTIWLVLFSLLFLSLAVSLALCPTLLRQEFYRLCSVSDPMKNCQTRRGGEAPGCIKIRHEQRCSFVSGDCCRFILNENALSGFAADSDVLANKNPCSL